MNNRVETQQKKSQLRSDLLSQISSLSGEQKKSSSELIQSNLKELLKNEKGIWGAFQSLQSEPTLDWSGISEHIQWAFPVTDENQMEFRVSPSRFELSKIKIQEPIDGLPVHATQLTGVVVPGLAFDSEGYRLGRGGGYYDRYFGEPSQVKKIGVCFSFAFSESLPHEEHDIVCDWVVTEKQSVATGQSKGAEKWS